VRKGEVILEWHLMELFSIGILYHLVKCCVALHAVKGLLVSMSAYVWKEIIRSWTPSIYRLCYKML
jgi:hypothetical protein